MMILPKVVFVVVLITCVIFVLFRFGVEVFDQFCVEIIDRFGVDVIDRYVFVLPGTVLLLSELFVATVWFL